MVQGVPAAMLVSAHTLASQEKVWHSLSVPQSAAVVQPTVAPPVPPPVPPLPPTDAPPPDVGILSRSTPATKPQPLENVAETNINKTSVPAAIFQRFTVFSPADATGVWRATPRSDLARAPRPFSILCAATVLFVGMGMTARLRYAAIAAFGGLGAPIFATTITMLGGRTFAESHADPLMWVIDAAPLVLGYIASLAGARQDRIEAANATLTERLADFELAATALESAMQTSEERGEQLERARAELHRFAKVCAHDLAAPLVGIQRLAEWVRAELEENAPGDSLAYLDKLEQRTERMSSLVRRIEEFASAGRRDHPNELFASQGVVQRIFEALDGHERFELKLQQLPPMDTAAKPFAAVFRALLRNAVQHHDMAEGTITVSATMAEPMVEFCVHDDGPGVDEKYRDKVFDLFVTLKRRDEVEATGAGLSIAKKIVESVGGSITIDAHEGRGTTLRFSWPINREHVRGELDPEARESIAQVRQKVRTLSGTFNFKPEID
jgi:signal transduction histidine kinase